MQTKPEHSPVNNYGCKIKGKDQLFYDRWAFTWKVSIDSGCPTRFQLFERIARILNPIYFSASERGGEAVLRNACDAPWLITGSLSCYRLHHIMGFALVWWLCNPCETSVMLCAPTDAILRQRMWAKVREFYTTIPGRRLGEMKDSAMTWWSEKDNRHGVFGIDDPNSTMANIREFHSKRQMVILDHASSLSFDAVSTCMSLGNYPTEFTEFMTVMLSDVT